MTETDRLSKKEILMASNHDRYIGSVIPKALPYSIHSDQTHSLQPNYVAKPEHYTTLLTALPLLYKEPYSNEVAIHSEKQFDTNKTSLPSLYAKLPSLLYRSEPPSNSDIFYLTGSFILHGMIILIACGFLRFQPERNNGNSNQGQPVEVVFTPEKTGSSGLTGEGIQGEEGQASPPPPSPAAIPESSPPPAVEQAIETPEPETEQIPDLGNLPVPIQKQQPTPPKKQPVKERQYTYRYTPPRPQPQRRQQTNSNSQKNPFETLHSLDFSENPNKSKRQAATHRLPRGSRSSVDMSTGPLVKNGRINVPYAAKINIKGVSNEYGDAINAWIRKHLYYPPDAARNGEDGSASVHVSLNRDGYVLSVSLTNSSGSDILDTAITGMFRGAQLPKIPPDLPDHFELDLTINYILLRR